MGIKERRTKILLILYLLGDSELKPVSFDEKTQKIFDLSLNQKTKGTLSALLKDEMIETASPPETTDKKYRLTDKGFFSLALSFPFLRYLKQKWDGKWRILSYEIPEKKRDLRDRLRREVAGWGLGPWHRSFWLTPHPIITSLQQLIEGKEEKQYVQAFDAEHTFGGREILIEKVWGKSELDRKYRQMFKNWHLILSQEADKLEKFKKIVGEYVNLLRQDPGLPSELLGQNWIGFEALNIYKEIRGILLS